MTAPVDGTGSAGRAGRELVALVDGRVMGVVRQTPRTAQLSFAYDADWQATDGAYPLSLSLPLARTVHGDAAVRTVLAGLLPDREEVRRRIAQEHHVSADDPFGLLSVLGEDCPGAVQFVRPERLETLADDGDGTVLWLSESDLVARLRALDLPGAPARLGTDIGYFSLPGAQPKIALYYDEAADRWGVPEGRRPTTHILKPPMSGRIEFVAAEHLAMALADAVDLVAAETFVVRAGDRTVLGVVRYDRVRADDGIWRRVHQEDVCQALGLSPHLKYERAGAPGVKGIADLLWAISVAPAVDVARLLDAVALNWIIVGTDAHARNYSVVIGRGGVARLAPFYDVASVLGGIVGRRELRGASLAMQIGGEYRALSVTAAEWRTQALAMALHPDDLLGRVRALAERVPDAMAAVAGRARAAGTLPTAVVDAIERDVVARARKCARAL